MRNRFKKGDRIELLTPNENFNEIIEIGEMRDADGNLVEDAKIVQQKLKIYSTVRTKVGDILRK